MKKFVSDLVNSHSGIQVYLYISADCGVAVILLEI